MKTTTFILAIALATCTLGVTAQQRGGGQRTSPEEMLKQRVEAVKKEVKLTADQEKQVTTLFTETQKKRAEMFQNTQGGGRGNWEANREKLQKLQDEENEAMKKILTEEQNKTYVAYLEKQRKEMEERMRSRGQGQGGRPDGGAPQGRPGGGQR
ncbi:MAG: hypothetical protein LBI96_04330 [Odoribacteraceae bacterium]|jgi:Spy/CpxP family protein refolding chaperone|nr:hypothetical protein [Odoribacteraceae bacterium]